MKVFKKPGDRRGPSADADGDRQPAGPSLQIAPLWSRGLLQRKPGRGQWSGRQVKLDRETLALIQGIFQPADAAHIRRRRGRLQLNLDYKNSADPFRWGLLSAIVQSGEKLVIEIGDSYDYAWHREVAGKTVTEEGKDDLIIDGLTLPSQSLTRHIYGKLEGFTSQEEDVSYIYILDSLGPAARINAMAHELLGHFYLAVNKVPFSHPDMLTEAHGILDPEGKPFAGRVDQFIEKHVETDANVEPYDPIFYE